MCFVQTLQSLRLLARPWGSQNCINAPGISKRKFAIRYHVDSSQAANISDTEKWRIGKADDVKTSGKRQVKARISFACILALFGGPTLPMPAADDVDLLLFNANVYTVNEKQPQAEA